MAVSTPVLPELAPKSPTGELVTVGRLVPSKRFDHAIEALWHVRYAHTPARLTIIGEGRERGKLEQLAERFGLADAVQLTGRVGEDEKVELLQQADVVVACAVREGWGLTTTEAARLGTPAVTYDVPGLRDAVIHGQTGLLTAQSPEALASEIRRLLEDRPLYEALRKGAWERWRSLTWDRTAASFERCLHSAVSRNGAGVPK
jgi:glycosyltransferase involved in cell wall biosynthesis